MRKKVATAILAIMVTGCGAQPSPSPAPEQDDVEVQSAAPADEATLGRNEAAAPLRSSRFTKLDDASCAKPRIVEETGDWVRRCDGLAPYRLDWSSGDLREDLAVTEGAASADLKIPTLVANGAFDSVTPTIEWRGPTGGRPDVLVVRVKVANAEGKDDSGSLVVASLGAKPCIVAIVRPSGGQSARARRIADSPLPQCLAG